MWQTLLQVLVKALEDPANDARILTIIEDIVAMFKANPPEFKVAVQALAAYLTTPGVVVHNNVNPPTV